MHSHQVLNYLQAYSEASSSFPPSALTHFHAQLAEADLLHSKYRATSRIRNSTNTKARASLSLDIAAAYHGLLLQMSSLARTQWNLLHLPSMVAGGAAMLIAVLLGFLFEVSPGTPSVARVVCQVLHLRPRSAVLVPAVLCFAYFQGNKRWLTLVGGLECTV